MRGIKILVGIMVFLLAASLAWALDLSELERRIDVLSDELDDMREQGGGGGESRVSVHGYGELHFNLPTDGSGDGEFDNHRFVLGVHAKLTDWIHLNAEIDFEHGAQELEFEFGYLDFLIDPAYNFRAGVMLAPVGFLNEFHEPPLFWMVERPDFQKRIIPTTWNVSGVGVFGTPVDGVNYRLYVVNALQSIRPAGFSTGAGAGAGGNGGLFRANDGIRKGRLQPNEAVFEDFAITGRLELTKLLPGMQVGVSFHTGNTSQNLISEGGRTTLLEADVKYRYKWFDMNASIAHISISDAAALNAFATTAGTGSGNIPSGIFGWNVQAGVHLPQLLGISTTHDFIPYLMYEFTDTQNEMPVGFAPDPAQEKKIIVVGVSYLPIPEVALKAGFQHTSRSNGDGEDRVQFGMAYMY